MDAYSRRQGNGSAVAGTAAATQLNATQLNADLTKILGHVKVSMRHGRVRVRVCLDGWESEHDFNVERQTGRAWLAYGKAKGDIP